MKLIYIIIFLSICATSFALSGRIVGGSEAEPHTAPYIVSIQWALLPTLRASHYCGGVLITFTGILSSAHCIQRIGIMRAVAAIHELDKDYWYHQTRDIIKAVAHESYTTGPNSYDIAVFRVGSPFESNMFVQLISLPQPNAFHFGQATVFGWGTTSNSTENLAYSNTLQRLDKEILHSIVCRAYVDGIVEVSDNNICTGPMQSNMDICGGDSGGPLVQIVGERVELVGIISWARTPCGSGPSVHIRVSVFISWILEQLVAPL